MKCRDRNLQAVSVPANRRQAIADRDLQRSPIHETQDHHTAFPHEAVESPTSTRGRAFFIHGVYAFYWAMSLSDREQMNFTTQEQC